MHFGSPFGICSSTVGDSLVPGSTFLRDVCDICGFLCIVDEFESQLELQIVRPLQNHKRIVTLENNQRIAAPLFC